MAKLSDLKALLAQAKAKAPVKDHALKKNAETKVRERSAAPDVSLHQIFSDVTPLPPRNRAVRAPHKPPPAAAQRLADESAALAESWHGTEPSPASWEIGQEYEGSQTFVRPGIGHDVLARLRRGHWVVQGEIDLHRLTASEARDALAEFLGSARARGWRCVRVIHGKGLTSPGREPVLKGKTRKWLSQWDEVLAYCEAPRHAGGAGAVIALLKAAT
ncbi:MAG TPA: Smr/MutS family protein [Casimicrobiaceae bacterium]|nr:Smr/MutS family protein [Casimicrobiaceae bacterium]